MGIIKHYGEISVKSYDCVEKESELSQITNRIVKNGQFSFLDTVSKLNH